MASAPTDEDVKDLVDQNDREYQQKLEAQRAAGKSFITPADGHGPGVVPEDAWNAGKSQEESK